MPAVGSCGHMLERLVPKASTALVTTWGFNWVHFYLLLFVLLFPRESSRNKIKSWDLTSAEIIHCDFYCWTYVHLCISYFDKAGKGADSALPGWRGLGGCCWNFRRVSEQQFHIFVTWRSLHHVSGPCFFFYSFREGLEFHPIRCAYLQLLSTCMQMRP